MVCCCTYVSAAVNIIFGQTSYRFLVVAVLVVVVVTKPGLIRDIPKLATRQLGRLFFPFPTATEKLSEV